MKTSSIASVLAVACVAALACSSTPVATPATAGTVPADLRDVERDGEGLVTTTFGTYPDRKADWTRAASVLSLLKDVWARSKAATPNLPSAQVKRLDAAIAVMETAIPAKDQRAAAMAANEVGLAVPELFDFFHPDAPLGVVRMDAVYRQVGLDGHFGNPDGVKADLASLQRDFAAIRGNVASRTGTCHRVGGTATVVADIDQSLGNVATAIPANDAKTIEVESDNGALEIDTLELLYDCPPDNVTPNTGLGSKCTTNAQCGAGLECDLANAGGKCAPASSNKIGTTCGSTIDCGTDSRAACATASGDAYPGGYCTMEPCDDIHVCPSGSTCVAIGGEVPACFKACAKDADCRAADGYVCQLFVTVAPKGFGPTDHACAFPCTRDADCMAPLKCDLASAKCTP